VTISGDTHRIDYAESPTYSGVVTDEDGAALAGVKVALLQREDEGWIRVASATTDQDGEVVLAAPPVYENTAMRLRTKGARSERWRVRVHPELTLATTVDGDTVTIVAAAAGGRPGDVVSLTARRDGVRVTLGTGILGPDGTVTFQVQQETRKARYAGRLDATSEHTADRAVVRVVKPKDPGSGEETPSPAP
jgi:hypothetical protein